MEIKTEYEDLPDNVKKSDHKEVMRVLSAISQFGTMNDAGYTASGVKFE